MKNNWEKEFDKKWDLDWEEWDEDGEDTIGFGAYIPKNADKDIKKFIRNLLTQTRKEVLDNYTSKTYAEAISEARKEERKKVIKRFETDFYPQPTNLTIALEIRITKEGWEWWKNNAFKESERRVE